MPATSQLDWLISTTAISVEFCARGVRDRLMSFGVHMGRSFVGGRNDDANSPSHGP